MRLLTLPVTIVRIPVELGLGVAKRAANLAQGLVGGGEETVVEEPRPTRQRRRRPARRSGNGRARTRATKPRTPRPAAEAAPVTEEPAPAAEAPSPEPSPTEEPASRPAAAGPTVSEPAPAAPPTAAAPAFGAAEPAHVSEEPELVAEAAEAGAEDGAGAEVAIDEPWPGYDGMNAADIEDRLVAEGAETAAAVSLYEASRKGRASVIEAASRSMTTG